MLRTSPKGLRMTKEGLNLSVNATCLKAVITMKTATGSCVAESEFRREDARRRREARTPFTSPTDGVRAAGIGGGLVAPQPND